jgi:starch phosphorylase
VMTPVTAYDALIELSRNLRWTWHTETRKLLAELPSAVAHPSAAVASLHEARPAELKVWVDAREERILALHQDLLSVVATADHTKVAYFSPEFGVAAEVAQYSGGLGILAGDHLKSASDLGVPLLGIGLLYRQGFFRQGIKDGAQTERYETITPDSIGAVNTGLTVTVPIAGSSVDVAVWKQMVGATPLYLLDTDVVGNSPAERSITDRLYSGDRRHRLDQELILGVGGVRALRSLGIAPEVFHLNEGHACFLLLELLAEQVAAGGTIARAVEVVRGQTLFTTHTPVPAGIDRFERSLCGPELAPWAKRLGISLETLLDWAWLPSDPASKPFNTAALAFELCGRANGVSQLHASVSRKLFKTVTRAKTLEGITNGVHSRTWVDPELQSIYDETLGTGWENGDKDAWAKVDQIDRSTFEAVRAQGRQCLVEMVKKSTGTELDPDGCVIGFARRFATYKRAALLLRDPDGLDAAFDAGAQFVFAGKAHPADLEGKAVLAELAAFAASKHAREQLVIVPDYDIAVAQTMYGGCDVWLNNPIRPREASGTSGEKAALNGGLNCSIADGWWADFFAEGIGWAIPTSDSPDAEKRDDAEARAMNAMIADEVLPLFGTAGWWNMVQRMFAHLGPLVTAGRMVAEYEDRYYLPIRSA